MAWVRPRGHVLDNVVWSALTGPQAPLALCERGARRFDPAFGAFIAVENDSEVALNGFTRLIAAHGDAALVEAVPGPIPSGVKVVGKDALAQMTATQIPPGREPDFAIVALSEADAPHMLALAALTQPGPFFSRTHQLGDFFGVKIGGGLVAMAGERMKPPGYTEISGVCTHPDHRGRGYAAALMRRVAQGILARGETPFLHAYAHAAATIGLYERLGFSVRREVLMRRVARP